MVLKTCLAILSQRTVHIVQHITTRYNTIECSVISPLKIHILYEPGISVSVACSRNDRPSQWSGKDANKAVPTPVTGPCQLHSARMCSDLTVAKTSWLCQLLCLTKT